MESSKCQLKSAVMPVIAKEYIITTKLNSYSTNFIFDILQNLQGLKKTLFFTKCHLETSHYSSFFLIHVQSKGSKV